MGNMLIPGAAVTIRRTQSPAAPAANATTAATPDNPQPPVKGEPNNPPSEDFSRTLDKKMQSNTPQEAQTTKKSEETESGSGAIEAAISIPVVPDKAAIAGTDAKLLQQIPSQTPDGTALLPAASGVIEATPVISPAAKPQQQIPSQAPDVSAPRIATSAAIKATPVIGPTAEPLASKPVPDQAVPAVEPTTDAGGSTSELIAPATSHTQSPPGAGSEPMQVSDKAFAPKELLPDAAAGDQGEPVAGKKTVITGEPVPSPHTKVEAPAMANQPAESSTTPAEQLLAPKATSTPGNTAAKLPNSPSATLGDQASPSPQYAQIRSEKPLQAAKHAISEKTGIDNNPLPDKTQLPAVQQKNTAQVGTVSVKSIAQKAGQPGTGSFSSQADNSGSLMSSGDGATNAESGEQALIVNAAPGNITEQSPASPESTRPAANAGSHPSVAEQIQDSVRTSFSTGSRQIVIHLNPPELGKVSITFREDADGITGLLQVDEPQTRHQLQQALPEIIRNLQDSGVQIKRIEVELTGQQQQYNPKDQSAATGQDGGSSRQNSSNFQPHRDNTPYNEWLTNIDPDTDFTEAQMQFASNSVNILV